MKITAKTDIGRVRAENQDCYRAVRFADGSAWALVCDGMGGANSGRLAAHLAADAMEAYWQAHPGEPAHGKEEAFLMDGFQVMNQCIWHHAAQNEEDEGMGTTGVCAYAHGSQAHIVHVGDSRAYLFREGQLTQLTRDHSMVQQLVEAGSITPEQAASHPGKNLITRALGVREDGRPEYQKLELKAGDKLLLCTDGLTNMVPDEAIAATLSNTGFFAAAERLVQMALEGGGTDNVTVLLLGMEPTEG